MSLVTSSPIRVLTLIENATVTGPARNLIEFGKLAMPDVQLTIVTYQRGPQPSALAQAARQDGLTVATVAERRRWDTQVFPQLRQVIAGIHPDLLETRNVKSHFLVRLLGLHKNYPWIAWNHGYTETSLLDRAYTQLDRWSLRGAYRVVTVCRPFADELAGLGVPRDRLTILHNSVKPFRPPPAQEVERLRGELNLQEDEKVVLSVGRLSREKAHADLVRAAAALKVKSGAPPFRIVIVGDGPEREPIAALAAKLGLADRITLAGFQRDTGPYYAIATAVAVPSHSEGSPNVVLEAMAAGLPIAATNVGGIPEILEKGVTGLMLPAGNPEAMAQALLRLLSERELRERLGAAARARAESAHTPDAYREALVKFYRETLQSLAK